MRTTVAGVDLETMVDPGLGNSCYLLDLGGGRALAVDPPRDLRALRLPANRRGLTVAFAADTHLHADFLTGARQLAATDSATILASAAGGRAFEHHGLADGDEIDLGGLTLRAVATPGHTDEHLSFLLLDGAQPVGVFTGGSLIVGSAARTDLLGAERTEELARAAVPLAAPTRDAAGRHRGVADSRRRLVLLRPAGRGPNLDDQPREDQQRLLAAPDEDTFVHQLLSSLGTYPAYFRGLSEENRRGPDVVTAEPVLPALDVDAVRRLLADSAVVVDVRPVGDIATGHLPGAVAIPLRDQFATWLGWLLDPATPVVIVRNPDQDPAEILWPALNIAFEAIAGELRGGVAAWREAGGEVVCTRLVRPGDVHGAVLDVRQAAEYETGHLPGSVHIELGDLSDSIGTAPGRPTVVMCGHGERAMTGASLLQRAGHRDVAVLVGGAQDWADATGQPLKDGS